MRYDDDGWTFRPEFSVGMDREASNDGRGGIDQVASEVGVVEGERAAEDVDSRHVLLLEPIVQIDLVQHRVAL